MNDVLQRVDCIPDRKTPGFCKDVRNHDPRPFPFPRNDGRRQIRPLWRISEGCGARGSAGSQEFQHVSLRTAAGHKRASDPPPSKGGEVDLGSDVVTIASIL
eukprot:403327-Amorphochlora_amoeboformis.AAC.1